MADDNNSNETDEERYNRELQEEVEKIQSYRKSLEEEFTEGDEADVDEADMAKKARKQLIRLIPDAGETLKTMMLHSSSDAVRASTAKFVFQEVMAAAKTQKDKDVLSELFESLRAEK